uniref:30S ribosomal protein S25e n=1 Tax=Thermofilum pendens TaxID=2269 RepID=A0A7C4BB14_THEPE
MGGGKKKPTVSQLEKRMKKEEKKPEEEKKRPQLKLQASTGDLTEVSLEAVMKEVVKMKYVTPYTLSSRFGLKMSRAKRVLRELASRGILVPYDVNHRVPIYVPAAKK